MSSRIRLARTEELTADELAALRGICDLAFGDAFTDEDWEHARGGVHVIALETGLPVAHASVVERELHVAGAPIRTGYVEAVATLPDRQRRGHGTAVMLSAGEHIRRTFVLGALDTPDHGFYERLGWERWRGPTFVRIGNDAVATPEEDDQVMILRTAATPDVDRDAPISCEWRPGDVW